MQWGAFRGTDLYDYLHSRTVTQVVLAGIATSIGVESTARAAYDHGYHVVTVLDAMTDLDVRNHQHSIEAIFPSLGETASTTELLSQLAKSGTGGVIA